MADEAFDDDVFDDDETLDSEEEAEDEDNEDEEDNEPAVQFAQLETKKSKPFVKLRPVQYSYHEATDETLIGVLMEACKTTGMKKKAATSFVQKFKGQVVSKDELIECIYEGLWMGMKGEMAEVDKLGFKGVAFDDARVTENRETAKLLTPLEVVEGIYVCPKCKNTKTQHYSVQLRRADEPPTVFIHCVNDHCKFKWKEG
jgi:DNA-directed RNA polymerase subunit M/transcription elongation factor TFIIS